VYHKQYLVVIVITGSETVTMFDDNVTNMIQFTTRVASLSAKSY